MLRDDLIFLDKEFKSSNSFLDFISDELYKKGYVKESFKEAILKREVEYPTGISTEKYNLAIPHTDSEHVNEARIAFVKFNNGCEFKEMCTNNNISVDMGFVLLVNKKEDQITLLSKLMHLFSQNEFLQELYNENNQDEIVMKINSKIG